MALQGAEVFEFRDGFTRGIVCVRDVSVTPRKKPYVKAGSIHILEAFIERPLVSAIIFHRDYSVILRSAAITARR